MHDVPAPISRPLQRDNRGSARPGNFVGRSEILRRQEEDWERREGEKRLALERRRFGGPPQKGTRLMPKPTRAQKDVPINEIEATGPFMPSEYRRYFLCTGKQ